MRLSVTELKSKIESLGVERCLIVLLVLAVILGGFQVLRYGATRFGAYRLGRTLEASMAVSVGRDEAKSMDDYEAILEKGLLGSPPKKGAPSEVKVFGILGTTAILGNSAGDAKPYEVGAGIPGGEKVMEIRAAEVVLEKEGKERIVKVFPDLPTRPGSKDAKTGTPPRVVAGGAGAGSSADVKPGEEATPSAEKAGVNEPGAEQKESAASLLKRLKAARNSK